MFELARGGAAGQIERAQAPAFGHQRMRERRQRRGRLVPRGGVHGRKLRLSRREGAFAQFMFIRREISGVELDRLVLAGALTASGDQAEGFGLGRRRAGLEQRDARRAEQREHAHDDGFGEFGAGVTAITRAARAEHFQHLPQEAHVAIILVRLTGEHAEQRIERLGAREIAVGAPEDGPVTRAAAGDGQRLIGAAQEIDRLQRLLL